MIQNEEIKKGKKIPQKVLNARSFLKNVNSKNYERRPSDDHKIAEAKLILAVYGCQQEGLPVTVTNLIMILGADATETLKFLTPATYPSYGIIDSKI